MTPRGAVALIVAIALVSWYVLAAGESLNQCAEWHPLNPVHEVTGWHREGHEMVKCYRGQVVDYADH